MKKILISLSLLSFSAFSQTKTAPKVAPAPAPVAAPVVETQTTTESPAFTGNINKGNIGIAASGYLRVTNFEGSSANAYKYLSLDTSGEYFFADHFSAGLSLFYANSNLSNAEFYVGPSATLYFLAKNKFAMSANAFVDFGITDAATYATYLTTTVSAHCFFTPSVSLAPFARLAYAKAQEGGTNWISYILGFKFNIFL